MHAIDRVFMVLKTVAAPYFWALFSILSISSYAESPWTFFPANFFPLLPRIVCFDWMYHWDTELRLNYDQILETLCLESAQAFSLFSFHFRKQFCDLFVQGISEKNSSYNWKLKSLHNNLLKFRKLRAVFMVLITQNLVSGCSVSVFHVRL